jgi:pimeloyl-ACP methyl ester carboxylesterase
MDLDGIDRAFIRLPAGRVHYRYVEGPAAPSGPPLFMAHGGPGCSRGLEPLIAALGEGRRVLAPDMLGNGDSDAPRTRPTDLGDYVDAAIQLIDALDIEQVDFYGDHTGAQIGAQLAVSHPHRVRRLILDGAPLFPPALKSEFAERYAPPIAPDEYGGYLAWVWGFVRDLTLHFPYYRTDPGHRLMASPVLPLAARHALTVDILKSLPSFHLAYQAAFSHDTGEWLAQIGVPTLLLSADSDPLLTYLDEAHALVPGAAKMVTSRDGKAAAIIDFLDRPLAGASPSRA